MAETDEAAGARLALFRLPGLSALAGIAALGAWYGAGGVALLAGLALATGLIARGWAAAALLGLSYERRLSRNRAFPGDVVRLEASLDNRKPLPLSWVQASEALPAALAPDDPLVGAPDAEGRVRLTFATPLGWYRRATLARDLPCRRRGWHQIGPARLTGADVFGLFLKSREAAAPEPLVVYPRLVTMADLGLPARHPLGAARDPQRLFEDPSRVMGLRPYSPETPMKAIAWGATARTGQLQAKAYEPTISLETVLFLAVDSFTAEEEDAFELAVSAMASLADHDLGARRAVGVYANGAQADGGGAIMIPPGRAPDQRVLILEHLARVERRAVEPFAQFLEAALSAAAGRATLAVIGARFDAAALAPLLEQRRRGRPVILLVAGDAPLPGGALPSRRLGLQAESEAA